MPRLGFVPPPGVTHAARRHGRLPVPGGPRPRASSHPGHNIPGGWADTGCKTHPAGRGGQRRAPMGAGSLLGGQRLVPSLMWGTHRRGDSSSALALHACKGDAVPAPAQNRRQRYPDLCHPNGDRGAGCWDMGGSSQSAELWAMGGSGAQRPPQIPSSPSLGALNHGLKDPGAPILGTPSPCAGGGTNLWVM